MAIDRSQYEPSFCEENTPRWICPSCKNGNLNFFKKDLHLNRRGSTEIAIQKDYFEFEIEWSQFTFLWALRCGNSQCLEIISMIGESYYEIVHKEHSPGEYHEELINVFRPSFLEPGIHIFNIPEQTPKKIKDTITNSFKVFFADPASAANHIRKSIELILDFLKVRKTNNTKSPMPLHLRIKDHLPAKHQSIKTKFLAIKWIGNSGSHRGLDISHDTVLDAYDILSHILDLLFNNDQKAVEKLVKNINRRKGRPKKAP